MKHPERARGGANPGGTVGVVSWSGDWGPSCALGSPLQLGRLQGRSEPAWRGAGFGSWRGWGGFPVVLSGGAIAAGNAHFVHSWVPMDWHPVSGLEECGPQVRELGLRGAGNHVVRPLLAQPGGRRKASPLGSRPLPLYPFVESSEPHSFPKQRSVHWKSKGQNPELWPAGPALLLSLCRPAGP